MNKVNRKFSFKLLLSIPILFAMFIYISSTQVLAANNIPEASEEFYVNDFAGIFTDSQKNEMIEMAEKLADIEDYGYQVVVTTVKTLNGEPIEDYSIKMANQYKIGKDGHGILILLATEDRNIRVEVGIGMEDMFTDSKAGRFIDKYAIPDLAENRFAEGIMKLQKAIIEEITTKVAIPKVTPTPQDNAIPKKSNTPETDPDNEFWAATSFLLALAACAVVFVFINNKHEKRVKREEELNEAKKEIESLRIEAEKSKDRISRLSDTCSEHERYISSYKSKVSDLNNKLSQYENELERADKRYQSLKDEKKDLSEKLSNLSERFRRAKILHPDLDNEIDEMIAKEIEDFNRAKAEAFDQKASSYLDKEPEPNSELITELHNLIFEYNVLNHEKKRFVKTDINKIKNLMEASKNLKYRNEADNISKQIEKAVSNKSHGTENDLSELYRLRNLYNNADYDVRSLVNSDLYSKLSRFIDEGEEEKKERIRREEERIKREKAEQISKQIERAISNKSSGTENELPKLYEAKKAFNNADYDVRSLVNSDLNSKLSKFIDEGEKEKKERIRREEEERRRREEQRRRREEEERRRREEEEEEERRHRSSYYSSGSSSFNSSSSHRSSSSHQSSGMGGGFRGGGSSRSF